MRNNTAPKRDHESETNVVYHFVCPDETCRIRNIDYIGLTTQTLRNRMTQHRYKGAIHDHFQEQHGDRPKVDSLIESTKIINRTQTKKLLYIAEAVAIELRKPKLNIQKE